MLTQGFGKFRQLNHHLDKGLKLSLYQPCMILTDISGVSTITDVGGIGPSLDKEGIREG